MVEKSELIRVPAFGYSTPRRSENHLRRFKQERGN